jgi:hypothetical protein
MTIAIQRFCPGGPETLVFSANRNPLTTRSAIGNWIGDSLRPGSSLLTLLSHD